MSCHIATWYRPVRLRWLARLGVLALTVAVSLLTATLPASAHVGVSADEDLSVGERATLTFRVPNESPDSSTVAVAFSLPTDHPLPTVSVLHQPGWTAKIATIELNPPVTDGNFTLTEAISSVTFTATDGVGIGPGEFAEFVMSVGPVPDVDSLSFPTEQTYSDGTIVNWDQPPNADGSEAEDPAPSLAITSRSAAGDDEGQSEVAESSAVSETTVLILSLAALVVAAVAMLMAAVAMRKRTVRSEEAHTESRDNAPGADVLR